MSCVFCSIIDRQIPAERVYEDEFVLAFKDINPLAKIHFVIVPKQCRPDFHSTEDSILENLFQAIKKIVAQYQLDEQGYRLVNNNGENAGQTVFHLHFHLLAGEELGHNLSGK